MLRFSLAVGLVACASAAMAQVPAGGAFQANAVTAGDQLFARVTSTPDGGFVVAWERELWGAPGFFAARRHAPDGTPQGGDIDLGSYSPGPTLAGGIGEIVADSAGNFAIVGTTYAGSPTQAAYQVLLRRFVDGSHFTISVGAVGLNRAPDVAVAPSGDFVVVWQRAGEILAQRLSPAGGGTPVGIEFRVNTYTTGNQVGPAVAVDGAGNFVVVWNSYDQDGSDLGVFGQRFDASGTPVGTEFIVNTYTTSHQAAPAVAAAPDGRFVVAWSSTGQDGNDQGVFAQRFSAGGAAVGGEFLVNTGTSMSERPQDVAMDRGGNFTVAWYTWPAGQIRAQRFLASGARRGGEILLNTTMTGDSGRLASDAEGNLVAVWRSPDGDASGVFGQRIGGLVPAALAVDTTGNGVLEPGESVDVRSSWQNLNGQIQTFGGAATLTGPAGATHTLDDGTASYGAVANGATAQCTDCYAVSVSNPSPRPVVHWDATLEEKLTPDHFGQDKLWRLHVGDSFADEPRPNPFYRFVETLLHHGVTGGCTPATYCPTASTTRAQMAVFVLVARDGLASVPRPCGALPTMFADVPPGHPFCRWIEELARRTVVSGCGGGNYCPGEPVSREQMAVFVLRTLDRNLVPPACGTPLYADVPAASPFCAWIEELTRRGVVTGCGGGNYCPTAAVTREQMGVFVSVTFGLTLYGP